MQAKFIYEKFTEDSDPIHDMGIGDPEKSVLPAMVKELAKYGIKADWVRDEQFGDGFWDFDVNSFSCDDDEDYIEIQLTYATDEAAKREGGDEGWEGGFMVYDDTGETILDNATHDIKKVVKVVVKLKYGNKREISAEIKKLEKKINKLKNIEKIL